MEPVVVASNRGPVSFSYGADGGVQAKRGAGGLVSSLGPLVRDTGALWLAAAMTDADRDMAGAGPVDAEGFRFRSLAIEPDVYRMAYDVISNGTLWFLHHGLFDLARRPRIDRRWREAWDAYRAYNHRFAQALIDEAPEGATVLVQDYHLALVGTWLAQQRKDLRAVHFTHIPFCDPTALRILPTDVAEEVLVGMASHTSCGFHASRWAAAFEACCVDVLGWKPSTFVAPLAPDHDDIDAVSASDACARRRGRSPTPSVIVQSCCASTASSCRRTCYEGSWPSTTSCAPGRSGGARSSSPRSSTRSREGLPEYLAYRQEVETLAEQLNATWRTPGWDPVLLDTSDNFARSVAALKRYDVLLVNPVRDGLNLVAKEGPMLNERDGVLALSREAGVWEELRDVALEVNPFDVAGTAEVIAQALTMTTSERAAHARGLREVASSRTPRSWLDDQLTAAAG